MLLVATEGVSMSKALLLVFGAGLVVQGLSVHAAAQHETVSFDCESPPSQGLALAAALAAPSLATQLQCHEEVSAPPLGVAVCSRRGAS